MRSQFLNDGIENFDFHTSAKLECQKLSKLILDGSYVPHRAQRLLVEKSKGLCRQLVIPTVRDALVLQCLSDALYAEVRRNAPTDRAFYQPQEHGFSSARSTYGTFASWLNFQKELFKFSKNRPFVVVTDIANYYDSISYVHLRNAIAGVAGVEECVLDMLIYVLSDLLWQPDYTPRIEVGLPQINLDAPRLLAHCFLYELDAFISSDPNRDFVRYMDDIDIGVDTLIEAKQALRDVDMVLQTKQVRLNSGKTSILTRTQALAHFRVVENAQLDRLRDRIDVRIKLGLPLDRPRRVVQTSIARGVSSKAFDAGNGEKILKRWIGLAAKTGASIAPRTVEVLLRNRPSVRENILAYVRSSPLTEARAKALLNATRSGLLVDDAAYVDLCNHLVETMVPGRSGRHDHIADVIRSFDPASYYGLYCTLWMQSKYGTPADILTTVVHQRDTWIAHERLGRLIGSFKPLFAGTPEEATFRELLVSSQNIGFRATYLFQHRLASDLPTFNSMFDALKNPNPSRGTGITHAKFLCLMAALQNIAAPTGRKDDLKARNHLVFKDIYYRSIARRLSVL
jgi:hypothetical protein